MNWLAFWASVIASLAWPAAVVAVALVFRRSLIGLLASIRQVTYHGATFSLGEQIQNVQAEATTILPEPATAPAPADPVRPSPIGASEAFMPRAQIVDLAFAAPTALVLEAWEQIDREARRALARVGIESKHANASGQLMALRAGGLLSEEAYGVIEDLRGIRNEATHRPKDAVGPKEALQYVDAAQRAVQALRDIRAR